MSYSVAWTPAAEADLRRLDAAVAERTAAKIEWLSENADTARIETVIAAIWGRKASGCVPECSGWDSLYPGSGPTKTE